MHKFTLPTIILCIVIPIEIFGLPQNGAVLLIIVLDLYKNKLTLPLPGFLNANNSFHFFSLTSSVMRLHI